MAERKAKLRMEADASGVEAGIDKAKRSINSLGAAVVDSNSRASRSIDKYVRDLQTQHAVLGKSAREAELYKLAIRGASEEQLKAAETAIKMAEGYKLGGRIVDGLKTGLKTIAAASIAGLAAAFVAFDQLTKKAGEFQDQSERIGDSASAIASYAVALAITGKTTDDLANFTVKLSKNLTGVDDESKAAGAAIEALGLDLKKFKELRPSEQIDALAKALAGFDDSKEKGAVLEALAKGASQLLPFLKEVGTGVGRVNILTDAQIALADQYADRQAKVRAELGLHAAQVATRLLPAYTVFTEAISDAAKQLLDVGTNGKALGSDNSIENFAEQGARSMATLADAAFALVQVFLQIGRNVGGVSAALAALADGNRKGAGEIIDDLRKQNREMVYTLGLADKVEAKFAQLRNGGGLTTGDFARSDRARGNRLKFNGATDPSKAADQAKAQLAFDLEDIKKRSQSLVDDFGNAQKIMEAQRAAGLLDEKEYYESKLAFLHLNSDEQERELKAEIARLQQEKLTGKDKIENDRKILDAEAKLAKVRKDALTGEVVLNIEAEASVKRREAAMLGARQAAQEYYDTLVQGQQRELDAIGKGANARNLASGLTQIDDRYAQQRRDLQNQRAQLELEGKFTAQAKDEYDKRLSIIEEFQSKSRDSYIAYYADLLEKQRDWTNGATEALQNYYDEAQNVAKGTNDLFTHAFQNMEDALVEFVKTGKLSFASLVDSIISDIARLIIRQSITGPLAGALNGLFGGGIFGGGGPGGGFSSDASLASFVAGTRATGGPVGAGSLYRVNENGPELLNVAGNQYLMMGDQPGSVEPVKNGAGGGVNVAVYVQAAPGMSRATALQQGVAMGEGARRALARGA